jgi:hypothetical protein
MYDADSYLVANPLNRYLINSPMLPDLKRYRCGCGVTNGIVSNFIAPLPVW